jgi:hypothetical protein
MARVRSTTSVALKKETFSAHFESWLQVMVSYGSIDGVSWYNYFVDSWFRFVILIYALVAVVGLPIFILMQVRIFLSDSRTLSATEWTVSDNPRFPGIIVCNPLLFNQTRMKGF